MGSHGALRIDCNFAFPYALLQRRSVRFRDLYWVSVCLFCHCNCQRVSLSPIPCLFTTLLLSQMVTWSCDAWLKFPKHWSLLPQAQTRLLASLLPTLVDDCIEYYEVHITVLQHRPTHGPDRHVALRRWEFCTRVRPIIGNRTW